MVGNDAVRYSQPVQIINVLIYMKETKDYPQSEADQDFAKLLKNIRTEENVSLDQLAMGFMSASQLSKIEKGMPKFSKGQKLIANFILNY